MQGLGLRLQLHDQNSRKVRQGGLCNTDKDYFNTLLRDGSLVYWVRGISQSTIF